ADAYTVTQPVATSDLVVDDGPGVTVTDLGGNVGRLQINTLGGDDTVTVDVAPGVVTVPITYDGGGNSDTLRVIGTPPGVVAPAPFASVTYSPGPAVTEGRLQYVDGGVGLLDMLIDFLNLEPIFDLVGALSLIVKGTNANNAINYTQGGVAANGRVSVDAFETIEFSNKDNLVINGLAGSDTVNLNNPNRPTGATPG